MTVEISKDSTAVYMQKAQNLKDSHSLRITYTKKAVAGLVGQQNDSLNSDRLIKMLRNFYGLNSWKDLKLTSKIVLAKSIEKNDDYFIGQSYIWLGSYYEGLSLNDSAFYYYLKAEKRFLKIGNIKLLADLYLSKSSIQIKVFDIYGAERSAIESLKYSRTIGDKLGEYDALINLGIAFNVSEDYIKSNYYNNVALDLIKEKKGYDQGFLKEIPLNNIANNYLYLKKYQHASKVLKKALQNKRLYQDSPRLYATILNNLAYSEFKQNANNLNSLNLFLESLRIVDSLGIDSKIIYFKNHLAEYYLFKRDTIKSLKYVSEALKLSVKTGSYDELLVSLKQISTIDHKNHEIYSKEYIKLIDSLFKKHRIAKNKFAAIAYETEEITQEKEAAVKKNWIIAGIGLAAILVLALLFIIKLQRAKQNRLQLQQLQQKESEGVYNLLLDQQSKIDQARSIEKKRIAQDLHDGVMNRLASTRLNLQNSIASSSAENLKKCIPLVDGIQDIEKEIRNIAHDLNRGIFSTEGSLIAIIETFLEEQRALSETKFHLEIDTSIKWELIAGYKKIHIFRIIQEAVQNIHKHADAKSVIVSILKDETQLLLEIFDDGKGFSLNKKKKGIGLQNIFSRAKSCNGIAEIKSKENVGTTIIIKIPI